MNNEKSHESEKIAVAPDWWHRHGIKMQLMKRKEKSESLELFSGVASLRITRLSGGGYIAAWSIKHSPWSEAGGRVLFTEKELKQAFGLTDEITESEAGLLKQYEGTTASAGAFIRHQEWLNIPCPGTGRDGDPNISLKIDETIKKEVQKFLDGN